MDARVKDLPDGERRVTRRADIPTRTDKPSKFGLDTSAMQQLGSLAADESISLLRQKASVNYNDDFYTFFSFFVISFPFHFPVFFHFHPVLFVLRFPFLSFVSFTCSLTKEFQVLLSGRSSLISRRKSVT